MARSWQVLWDFEGVIQIYFLLRGIIVNAHHYSNLLCNDVHQVICEKRLEKVLKIIVLHDSSYPHFEYLIKNYVGNNGLVNHEHFYSFHLTPSGLHVFGPMKVHLKGQNLRTCAQKAQTSSSLQSIGGHYI
jgi:hypothetical protein